MSSCEFAEAKARYRLEQAVGQCSGTGQGDYAYASNLDPNKLWLCERHFRSVGSERRARTTGSDLGSQVKALLEADGRGNVEPYDFGPTENGNQLKAYYVRHLNGVSQDRFAIVTVNPKGKPTKCVEQ
jgi:hypothetical protein